jgi:RNA polymerase sigma-70 factor (family 1)
VNSFDTYNDEQLILMIKNGEGGAFTALYNHYWHKLFSVAANKLGRIDEAEELVQDIFLDIWHRRDQLNITGELKAYLAVAVKYRVINVLAKRNRAEKYKKDTHLTLQVADHNLEDWLSFKELKDRLASLVVDLPDKCRLVYKLSREEGYSRKEIAHALDISEKTVESHLTRALNSLRNGLRKLHSVFLSILL